MIKPLSVVIAAVLLLGPLLTAELGMRALIEGGRLPVAPSSSDFADVSFANAWRRGQPELLILGASSVRSGVRAEALERLISKQTDEGTHVQGVAQGGISFDSQTLIVQALAEEGLLPELVVLGLTPLSLAEDFPPEGDWLQRSELGGLWAGCPDDALDPKTLECYLSQLSALWRWRGRPDDVAQALAEGWPHKLVDGGRTLMPSGWLSARPSTAERLEEQLPRALDRLDPDVTVEPEVVASFTRLIDTLRAEGVEVVALRMPYLPQLEAALVERNPAWVEQLEAAYAQLARAADIELLDTHALVADAEADWFRDPRHLSKTGAAAFTKGLWKMPEVHEPILEALDSEG